MIESWTSWILAVRGRKIRKGLVKFGNSTTFWLSPTANIELYCSSHSSTCFAFLLVTLQQAHPSTGPKLAFSVLSFRPSSMLPSFLSGPLIPNSSLCPMGFSWQGLFADKLRQVPLGSVRISFTSIASAVKDCLPYLSRPFMENITLTEFGLVPSPTSVQLNLWIALSTSLLLTSYKIWTWT